MSTSTFHSCGSSSRLQRRSFRPTRELRGIAVQLEHWLRETVEGDEVVQLLLRVGDHRAKLEHPERAAARAGADLREQHRPAAVELDGETDQNAQREERRAPSR